MRLTLSFLVFSLLFISTAFAEPLLETKLTRNKINTSETSVLTLEIKWPKAEAKYQFAFPPFNLLENLSIIRQGESQESFAGDGGEWLRKTFEFEIQGKKAGAGRIPEFELSYFDPISQKSGKILVPSQTLTVSKKSGHKTLFIVLGLILFAAGLTARLKKLFGRWNEKGEDETALPLGATSNENFKIFVDAHPVLNHQFSSALTTHLKRFLNDSYAVPSLGHTIDVAQTLAQIEAKGIPRDEIYEIKNILSIWEQINYAGRVSDLEFREFRTQLLRLIQNKMAVTSLS